MPLLPAPDPSASNLEAVREAMRNWGVTTVVVPDDAGLPPYQTGPGHRVRRGVLHRRAGLGPRLPGSGLGVVGRGPPPGAAGGAAPRSPHAQASGPAPRWPTIRGPVRAAGTAGALTIRGRAITLDRCDRGIGQPTCARRNRRV